MTPSHRDHPHLYRGRVVALSIFLLMLSVPGSALAQWSTNGGNINNTNTENVGIGTSTPGAKLDIRAGAAARGTYSDVLVGGGPDGIPQLELFGPSISSVIQLDSTGLFFWTNGPSWRSPLFLGHNGNVGVGTSSPANLFHVNNSSGTGSLLVSGSGLGLVNMQDLAAPANAKLFQWRSEGGVFRMSSINDAWSGFVQQNIFVASAGGNIGVGTSAPMSLQGGLTGLAGKVFQIQNSSGASQLAISASGAGNVSVLGFEVSDATASRRFFQQLFDGANNVFKFRALDESSGAVTQDNILTLKNTGNVGIGTASPTEKLHVTGNVKVSGNIDVGGNINAKYQDMAEWVESSQVLAAGTVVIVDPARSNQVIASSGPYDSRVAGVISTRPGVALGEAGDGRVLVATTGRVKVRVDAANGPIGIGDLLVTSAETGMAMKSLPVDIGGVRIHRPGTLIGKALEPLAQGTGEILVLLALQ